MRYPFAKHQASTEHSHRSNYGPGVSVVPSYVQIAGHSARDFAKSSSVDLIVLDDANAPASWRKEITGFLSRTIRDQFGKSCRVTFSPTGTPDGSGIPVFDLILRQSDGAATLQKAAGPSNYQPEGENHHGVMVAFHVHPAVSQQIAVRGGVDPKEHHITMAFLGDKEHLSPAGAERLKATVASFAKVASPLSGNTGGSILFNNDEDGEGARAFGAHVDAPHMHTFAHHLHNHLRRNGFAPSDKHGHTAHITTAFVPKGMMIQNTSPFPGAPGVLPASISDPAPMGKDADFTAMDDSVAGMGAQFAGINSGTALPDMPKIPLVMDTIHLHIGDDVTSYPLRGRADSDGFDNTDHSGSAGNAGTLNLGNPLGDTFAAIGDGYAEPVTTAVDAAQFDCDQVMLKAASEQRYTFSVVYKASQPGDVHEDAHSEFTTAGELQTAQWDYVKRGNRSIFVQHGLAPFGFQKAGEWVDIVQWPYSQKAVFKTVDGSERQAEIPAGSVYMGVHWEPWAWEHVKAGRIRGFSFGGKANRTVVRL